MGEHKSDDGGMGDGEDGQRREAMRDGLEEKDRLSGEGGIDEDNKTRDIDIESDVL